MPNNISPQDAVGFRQELGKTTSEVNSAINEFNREFKTAVPTIKTFGNGDVDRVWARKADNTLLEFWRKNNISRDPKTALAANKAFRLAEATIGIGIADAALDQNASQTRKANFIQKIFEDNDNNSYAFHARANDPKSTVKSFIDSAMRQLGFSRKSTSESP